MMNRSTLSLLVLLTAGACAETPETSYRENYPVQVRAQTIALPLATPQSLSPEDEARLGVLKVLPLMPKREVAFSLFRRRQPMSRRKETFVNRLRQALRD